MSPRSRRPGTPRGPGALLVLLLAAATAPAAAAAEPRPSEEEIGSIQVYLTPDQAVREVFEGVAAVDTVVVPLAPAEHAALVEETRAALPETLVVLRPRGADGALLGFAVVGDEVGKYRPITFLVGTHPDLSVRGVEVLVYRESRGGEVRRSRFLRQYRGKTAGDPVHVNRDIINVAGATLSVNALNRGVKGVLTALESVRERIQP